MKRTACAVLVMLLSLTGCLRIAADTGDTSDSPSSSSVSSISTASPDAPPHGTVSAFPDIENHPALLHMVASIEEHLTTSGISLYDCPMREMYRSDDSHSFLFDVGQNVILTIEEDLVNQKIILLQLSSMRKESPVPEVDHVFDSVQQAIMERLKSEGLTVSSDQTNLVKAIESLGDDYSQYPIELSKLHVYLTYNKTASHKSFSVHFIERPTLSFDGLKYLESLGMSLDLVAFIEDTDAVFLSEGLHKLSESGIEFVEVENDLFVQFDFHYSNHIIFSVFFSPYFNMISQLNVSLSLGHDEQEYNDFLRMSAIALSYMRLSDDTSELLQIAQELFAPSDKTGYTNAAESGDGLFAFAYHHTPTQKTFIAVADIVTIAMENYQAEYLK